MEPLQYNTSRVLLKIPEYGRHIHKMIDQAIEVRNKDERNKIAKAIIGVMGNLNPHLRDVADFQHKLWDQLFIMSRFKLDVDCPFEKPNKDFEISGKAVFRLDESAVTSTADIQLLDNATGEPNDKAPGADRYAITLTPLFLSLY